MSYTTIDAIIKAWVSKHGLALSTQYKDSEVRSVHVNGEKGRKFQIWIDRPKDNQVAVHAWDYKKQRRDWDTTLFGLSTSLEEAINTVRSWDRTENGPGSPKS